MGGANEFETVTDDIDDEKTAKFCEISLVVASVALNFLFFSFSESVGDSDVAT